MPSNKKTYRVKQKQYTKFHTITITNIDKHRNTQNQFTNMNNTKDIANAGSSQKGGGHLYAADQLIKYKKLSCNKKWNKQQLHVKYNAFNNR